MTVRSSDRIDLIRRRVLAAAALASTQFVMPVTAVADTKPSNSAKRAKMNIDHFVQDCIAANEGADAQAAVNEVLARAVSSPEAVLAALGDPRRAGLNVLLSSPTLTIFAATWTPQMNLMPHDHLMWANIGIYTGREDNLFWKRTPDGIRAYGADALFVKDTAMLAADELHSVTNPLQRFTGGIHIYGGDFFNTTRSQWDPETLAEEPSGGAKIREMFQRENVRLGLDKDV